MSRYAVAFVFLALILGARSTSITATRPTRADPELTVHEWGTFTTVAGQDGRAIDWLPLGGPTDLPCFVEHFQNRKDVKVALNQPGPLDYTTARSNLWGKVRMETPVLYFYAAREKRVSVRVRFPHGLMTEWYPHATVTQPLVDRRTLRDPTAASILAWPNVTVSPDSAARFPAGKGDSHYYAARNTAAAPLAVGDQHERFLFYRGVGSFDVPLVAEALGDRAVRIRNEGRDPLPSVLLFQNRRGVIHYRLVGVLGSAAIDVTAPSGGTVAELRHELERLLVAAGLYPREATAMVDTWRDSWFEEGTRVIYVLRSPAVDAILPLTVAPAPSSVARVFVGRMEVITPDIERSVEAAIASRDTSMLQRYGRFLGPITDRILAKQPGEAERQRIGVTTASAFASYLRRASTCQ